MSAPFGVVFSPLSIRAAVALRCCRLREGARAQPVPSAFHYQMEPPRCRPRMITPADIELGADLDGHITNAVIGGESPKAPQGSARRGRSPRAGLRSTSCPTTRAIEPAPSEGLKRSRQLRLARSWRDDAAGLCRRHPRQARPAITAAQRGQWAAAFMLDGAVGHSACIQPPAAPSPDHQRGLREDEGREPPLMPATRRCSAISKTGGRVCHTFTKASVPFERSCRPWSSPWTPTGPAPTARCSPPRRAALAAGRNFDPSARPRPVIEEPPPAPIGDVGRRSEAAPGLRQGAGNVDTAGTTTRFELAAPPWLVYLRADELFDKVGRRVDKAKAGKRIGSAAAISESELLTNCHVVGDHTQVTLVRDKQELTAKVVSMNADADRCVLQHRRQARRNGSSVRPYDDIKVGERAVTIGTPQGLELTVAEGIVSSKRSHNNSQADPDLGADLAGLVRRRPVRCPAASCSASRPSTSRPART